VDKDGNGIPLQAIYSNQFHGCASIRFRRSRVRLAAASRADRRQVTKTNFINDLR